MTDENNNISMFTEDRFEPCRVCGEPSSGWHCGAVTCEACKKFFLRSINGEDSKYKCLRNQDCVIVRTTRTQCQYCRFQKCKEVGMTNNENPNSPTVAEIFKGFPCNVCKAPSSGVHFGAITCEGCKGFFRRSIKERAPERYRCMEKGNCEVSAATRNMCRYCRFQRCLKAGMSAQNSRIGRQSNLFKHNIIEWQSRGVMPNSDYLITQRKMKRIKNEATFLTNPGSNDYTMMGMNPILNGSNTIQSANNQSYSMNAYSNTNNYAINNPNNMQNNNQNYYSNSYYDWSQTSPSQSNFNYNNQMIPANNSSNQQMISHNFSHNTHSHNASNTSSSNPVSAIEDSLETSVRDLIKVIHQSYQVYLSPIVQLLKDELNKNANHYNYHQRLSQNQNQIQYQLYQPNNLLDKKILHEIIDHLRFYARKFANFSENIPGLGKLSTSDKEELIKCSIHSVVLLSLQRKCEHFNYFNGEQSKIERFHKEFPILFRTNYFMKTINEKFEKFKLDEKEYALYSALLVISTASKYLIDYDRIMEIREEIGTALRQYMFARRNEEITCDEILLMLVFFRKFNSILQKGFTSSYYKIMQIDSTAFNDYLFFPKVYLPNQNELKSFVSPYV